MDRQIADPQFDNLTYDYSVQSQRLFLETKILMTFHEQYHPFVSLGVGNTKNKAYGYTESPKTSDAIPMIPGFSDYSSRSMAYLLGFGIEKDLTAHIRLGGAYRYVGLNKARLGLSPLQDSLDTLKNNRLVANEFLLQLSFLG